MCKPSTPKAPPPVAAAPKLPTEVNRGTNQKKKSNPNIVTSARGIYQPLPGKDFLGQ